MPRVEVSSGVKGFWLIQVQNTTSKVLSFVPFIHPTQAICNPQAFHRVARGKAHEPCFRGPISGIPMRGVPTSLLQCPGRVRV